MENWVSIADCIEAVVKVKRALRVAPVMPEQQAGVGEGRWEDGVDSDDKDLEEKLGTG
jgi:hypothetical protein